MGTGAAYHRLGPITPGSGEDRKFASLYTHSVGEGRARNNGPTAGQWKNSREELWQQQIADERMAHMRLPAKTSRPHMSKVTKLLKDLDARLKIVNPYVRDFISIAQWVELERFTEYDFVINPDAAPEAAGPRT